MTDLMRLQCLSFSPSCTGRQADSAISAASEFRAQILQQCLDLVGKQIDHLGLIKLQLTHVRQRIILGLLIQTLQLVEHRTQVSQLMIEHAGSHPLSLLTFFDKALYLASCASAGPPPDLLGTGQRSRP